ncbi:hypothetical protein KFE25_000366 [Diacronema lutheri]|uniref:RING-type domain-containing protein n=1 Tax=Diacronema lutheri TaxID=2081491 RepID=A0A8J5XX48_DIALT|nr:hypothetical protein KFE25_000366 [Diacronema lutheri]
MGRPDEVRHAMEERQRKWMSERSAEEARRDVQAELAAAAAARGARAPASAARGPPAGYSSHASAAQAAAARAHACTASDGHDGLAHSIGTPAELAGPGAHVVLDRITERLAQRMRSELAAELSRESAKAQHAQRERSQRAESRLSAEVASHTCPICYELMAGTDNGPVLLVPCGHTLCAACVARIDAHAHSGQRRAACPICRAPVDSRAPNVSLRSIVNALLATRDAVRSAAAAAPHASEIAAAMLTAAQPRADGGGGGGGGGAFDDAGHRATSGCGASVYAPASVADAEARADARRYASQFQSFCMRAAVLAHEAEDTRGAIESAAVKAGTAHAVLVHLRAERATADERARAAAAEAALLAEQEVEQAERLRGLRAHEAELREQLALLERTLEPLRTEADKARFLALQLDPSTQLDDGLGAGGPAACTRAQSRAWD